MREGRIRDHSDSIIANNILVIAGISGFLLGAFLYGTWQLAAETAQVIAGKVQYPANNPFYWYHSKAWTLLHQLFVPLLWLGFTEKTLSFLLSGLMGMLSFQALAMTVWVISKDAMLAIGAPFIVLFTDATGFFNVYPVFLLGTPNTHGVIGMSLFLLIIALLSSEKQKTGLFLLGIFPSIHFSIAVLCSLVVTINYFASPNELQKEFRLNAKYFLMGAGVSALSLLIHFLWIYDVPNIQASVTRKYFDAFVQSWDSHRKPIDWNLPIVYLNAGVCIISFVWTTIFHKHLKERSAFIVRSFCIAGLLGFVTIFLSRRAPAELPEFYLTMMPSRMLEFNNFAFFAFVLGLCGIFRTKFFGQLILAAFVLLATWKGHLPLKVILLFAAATILLPSLTDHRFVLRTRIPAIALRSGVLCCLFLMAVAAVIHSDRFHYDFHDWELYNLSDPSNDQFFASQSQRSGLLLTCADLHLIQLRSRRPVLLDGGQLDMLPYAPETGPEMATILSDVYGIDLFSPPKEAYRTASIPKQPVKTIWELRTTKDWQTIRAKYGVTEILTYADWKLNLPVISRNANLAAYLIPN